MTGPPHLSERMLPVLRGRGGAWTPEEMDHLAACPECAAEWSLVQAGSRLGREVEAELDTERVANALRNRLRSAVPARSPWRAARVVAFTAAAAVILVLLARGRSGEPVWPTLPAQEALLPELEALEADELEAVLDILPPAGTMPMGGIPEMGDLSDEELERVLRSMEGSS